MIAGKVNSKFVYESNRLNSDFHLAEGVIYDRLIRKKLHKPLGELTSEIFCAGRSKRIYVNKEKGIPYLGNTDISSSNQLAGCKYASKKIWKEEKGFLKEGMILTGRVGQNTVGAYSYASKDLEGAIGSDNVIRIISNCKVKNGYLFSFLASKYGYHLSRRHISGNAQPFITEDMLAELPIPILSEAKQNEIHDLIVEASEFKVEANRLLNEAITYFENKIGISSIRIGFHVDKIMSNQIFQFHKRLDSQYNVIRKKLIAEKKDSILYKKIKGLSSNIFVGGRGKRMYVKNGIAFLSSSDMMLFNPIRRCKMVSNNTYGINEMMVSKYDILISRSGTVGNTVIVGDDLTGTAISEHALRLVIDMSKISPNYVFCFLKTKYGLRTMEASSFGSVIITLNEELIGNIELPILSENDQQFIIDKIESYIFKMDEATKAENQAIDLIEKEIESWQE
jgi:type I restriction enzyme S subunit